MKDTFEYRQKQMKCFNEKPLTLNVIFNIYPKLQSFDGLLVNIISISLIISGVFRFL